jgi:hypothetical protein
MSTLTFQAAAGGSLNLVGPNITANVNLTLPSADGTSAGQVLQTNGAGTLAFSNQLQGSSSALAAILTNAAEVVTVSATAATGTINYYPTSQSILYYTSNATANWTVNFAGSSGTTMNSIMAIGQAITVAFLVTQGSTAYYNNAITIDGASVTPKYQNGGTWVSGNTSGIDCYVYTIIKTASATYTVLASQTQYK